VATVKGKLGGGNDAKKKEKKEKREGENRALKKKTAQIFKNG